jgi:hypothetical protein
MRADRRLRWQPVNKLAHKLFTGPAGEQVVQNKPVTFPAPRACFQLFLDRTVVARRHEKPAEGAAGIIPGNRGKVGRSWCGLPLLLTSNRQTGRQISPAPLDGVAPVQSCESGAEWQGAIRNRVRAKSGLGEVSTPLLIQLPRGLRLLLESQHASTFPGGTTPPKGFSPRGRSAQRRRARGERAGLAKLANAPTWGGAKNRVTQLQRKRSLRDKRSDP